MVILYIPVRCMECQHTGKNHSSQGDQVGLSPQGRHCGQGSHGTRQSREVQAVRF